MSDPYARFALSIKPLGGNMCEDYPCCGHEMNDCRGQKYGSDDSIIAAVHARMSSRDYDPYYDDNDY
jgi:hypothetical protein